MMKRTKYICFGFLLLSFVLLVNSVSAVSVSSDILFETGNITYKVNSGSMSFNRIIINASDICFNNTNLNISSSNNCYVNLTTLSSNIVGASVNDKVLGFTSYTSSGMVYFNISGFEKGQSYDVRRDGILLVSTTSSASGVLSFSSSIWSEHDFDIYEDVQTVRVLYTRSDLEDVSEDWDVSLNIVNVVIIITLLSLAIGAIFLFNKIRGGT